MSGIYIEGWMIKDLNLKGCELLLYAITHFYSKMENGSMCMGEQRLADITGYNTRQIGRCLSSLVKKNLIEQKSRRSDFKTKAYVTKAAGTNCPVQSGQNVPQKEDKMSTKKNKKENKNKTFIYNEREW